MIRKRIFLSIVSLLVTFNVANAASNVVAVLEGEISGTSPRDKVMVELSATPEQEGKVLFSQCVTINQKVTKCDWIESAFAFHIIYIQQIQASIPNDTIRVFTDGSTAAAEARSFLRMQGSAFAKAVESAIKGEPVQPLSASGIYDAHKVFPYILWRARTL